MAGIDYYRCDMCGCKCFYDANLAWEDVPLGGTEVRDIEDTSLENCGDIKALCIVCSKTHIIKIEKLSEENK